MRLSGLIFLILLPAAVFAETSQTESFSITTYYPSPNGVFRNIRLYPTTEPPAGHPARVAGSMFFNITDNKLYVFNGTSSKFEVISSGNSGVYWVVNGLITTNVNMGNVGVGTTAPGYKLEVNGTAWATDDFCLPSGQCVSKIP